MNSMKIILGKYINWYGPYQILGWLEPLINEKVFNILIDKTTPLLEWIHDHRHRKVQIKLDPWDTWSTDSTLAIITLPLLIQLKETKQGASYVSNKDVPKNLRSDKDDIWGDDSYWFERWDYILDEMIWTFQQLQDDVDWEGQYYYESLTYDRYDFHINKKGLEIHSNKIDNGLRLFGKYYRNLWD